MPNEVFPSADKKSAIIRCGYPPRTTSMMTTSDVDETLVAFGRCRAVMLPAYPDTWPRDQAVECDRDPKFDFANDHLAGDVLFRIRDEPLRMAALHHHQGDGGGDRCDVLIPR